MQRNPVPQPGPWIAGVASAQAHRSGDPAAPVCRFRPVRQGFVPSPVSARRRSPCAGACGPSPGGRPAQDRRGDSLATPGAGAFRRCFADRGGSADAAGRATLFCIAVPVRPANALGPMVRSWRASENAPPGDGQGLSRQGMSPADQERARRFRDPETHGPEHCRQSPGQGVDPASPNTESRDHDDPASLIAAQHPLADSPDRPGIRPPSAPRSPFRCGTTSARRGCRCRRTPG
jgi:hypothetical protein